MSPQPQSFQSQSLSSRLSPIAASLAPLNWPTLSQNYTTATADSADYTDIHWAQHYCERGQQEKAQHKFETALAHFAQAEDAIGIGKSLNGLSQVCIAQAQYDRALAYSRAAASILAETVAESDYAIACYRLGVCYFELDQFERAERHFEQALAKFQALAEVERENYSLIYLGQIYAQQHQVWCALACYDAVLNSLATQPFMDQAEVMLAMVLQAIKEMG